MNFKSNASRNYLVINKILDNVKNKLQKKINFDFEYSRSDIVERISQLVCLLIASEFSLQSINNSKNKGKSYFDSLPENLNCNQILINTNSSIVKPSVLLFILNSVRFLALWLFILFSFLVSCVFNNRNFGKATLIFGIPRDLNDDNCLTNFENYCMNTTNSVIRKSNGYVTQFGNNISTKSNSFIYSKIPLLSLLLKNTISPDERRIFLKKHFYIFFNYLFISLRFPIICILWKDYALHSSAESLNRRDLIDSNIITNSNSTSQDLWMNYLPNRNFKTYLALYSQNTFNFIFKDDPIKVVYPLHRFTKADLVWVWNEEYKHSLIDNGSDLKIKVVDPVLWFLPIINLNVKKKKIFIISVFDVPPFDDDFLLSIGLDSSYYNASTSIKFLDDIIEATEIISKSDNIHFEIFLKHKRIRYKSHDQSYFKHVDLLCKSKNSFNLVNHDVNLYSFTSYSNLAIAVPFSSPVLIAKMLNIPSFYYDPNDEIFFPKKYFPKSISKVSSLKNLVTEIRNRLNNHETL